MKRYKAKNGTWTIKDLTLKDIQWINSWGNLKTKLKRENRNFKAGYEEAIMDITTEFKINFIASKKIIKSLKKELILEEKMFKKMKSGKNKKTIK